MMDEVASDDDPLAGATYSDAHRSAGALLRGTSVGRYIVVDYLGGGGMGVVYAAYDPELNRKIAIKLLNSDRSGAASSDQRTRLLREAQAMARLSHPNVLPVYDVGTFNDEVFIAMELVEGTTVKAWLREQPRSVRDVLGVFVQAGRGLAAAHASGIIHRDFKPDNLLLGRDGRIRVVDFGLARAGEDAPTVQGPSPPLSSPSDSGDVLATPITRSGAFMGTPAYMAPEQMSGREVEARTDQFSFCVALYEALYHERPFAGETPAQLYIAILKGRLNPAPKDSRVPAWLRAVLARGLSPKPSERYPSMDALLDALGRDPAASRRRGAAIAGLCALVGVGFVTWQKARREQTGVCRGGARKLEGIWDAQRKEAMRRVFAASGKAYAADAFSRAARNLDDYAARWTRMHGEACEATRIHGEQSEEVLDLRMACLSGRLRELSALVDVLGQGSAEAVQEAPRATESLPDLAQCADVAALKAPAPRPRDPAQAARVEALQQRLAQLQAQYAVGNNVEAARIGEKLVLDAEREGYGPLVAEAYYWRARSYADLSDDSKSVPGFQAAFAAALASGKDAIYREAAIRLAQELIYKKDRDQYKVWERIADAAVRRFPDRNAALFLDAIKCESLYLDGKINERFTCFERHAAEFARVRPLDEWRLTALGDAATDAGELDTAIDALKRGVAYSAQQFGELHPRTLEMRAWECKGLEESGAVGLAIDEGRRTLAMAEKVAPDDVHLKALIQLYLGAALLRAKQYREARTLLEAATIDSQTTGTATSELARLSAETGDRETAIKYLKHAIEEDVRTSAPDLLFDLVGLGEVQLRGGDARGAMETLDRAHRLTEETDLSKLWIADEQFAHARARFLARPKEREQALAEAREARAYFAERASRAAKFREELERIERWLKNPGP
jgi:tetratricopeptide (TPR) repeat protein